MLPLSHDITEYDNLLNNSIPNMPISPDNQKYKKTLDSLLNYSKKLDDYIEYADNILKGRK